MARNPGGRNAATSNSAYGSHYNVSNVYNPSYSGPAGIPQNSLRAFQESSGSRSLKTHIGIHHGKSASNINPEGARFGNSRGIYNYNTSLSKTYNSSSKSSLVGSIANDVMYTNSASATLPVNSRDTRFAEKALSGSVTVRMGDSTPQEKYFGDFSNYPDTDSVQNRSLGTGGAGLAVPTSAYNYSNSRVPNNVAVDCYRGSANMLKEESDQSRVNGVTGAGNASESYVKERSRHKSGSPKVQRKLLDLPPSYEESLTEGTVGLENMGNTCYFNSAIQCISNTLPLRDTIVGSKYSIQDSCDTKGKIISSLKLLLKDMWLTQKPFSSVRPRDFFKVVAESNSQFEGYRQQDAQEMLLFLLNALSEETNRVSGTKSSERRDSRVLARPKSVASLNNETADRAWERFISNESSFVTDVVAGQLESILECKVCSHKSVTYESFFQISLPIPSAEEFSKSRSRSDSGRDISLDDCFKLFCKEEILDGDNAVLCEKCRKPRRCSKTFRIQRLPDVLIIQIKRFSLDFRTKIDTPVVAPMKNLCLVEYMTEFKKRAGNPPVYRLSAVIDHMGSPRSGHYVAKCVVPYPPYHDSSSTVYRRGNYSRSPNPSRSYIDDSRGHSPNPRSPSRDGNRSRRQSCSTHSKSWWLFDDSSVNPVDERDVVSPYNYILFYEKETD